MSQLAGLGASGALCACLSTWLQARLGPLEVLESMNCACMVNVCSDVGTVAQDALAVCTSLKGRDGCVQGRLMLHMYQQLVLV